MGPKLFSRSGNFKSRSRIRNDFGSGKNHSVSTTLVYTVIRPHLEELPLPDGGEGVEGHVAHHNEDAAEGGGHRATRVPAVVLAEEEADHADRDEEGHRVLVELVLLLRDQAAHQHYGDHLARLIASTFRDLC